MATKDTVKYVTFQSLDGSKVINSTAKFLSYLYRIGKPMSEYDLKNKHMQGATTGTFTIAGEHWVYNKVFGAKDIVVHSTKRPYETRKEYTGPLQPLPREKKIHVLNANHSLELTYIKGILFHTKSITI